MSLLVGVAVVGLLTFPVVCYAVVLAVDWQLGGADRPEPSRPDTGRRIPGRRSDREK